ncbi:hypothetical protein REPUB_Repub07fG0213700 [Reevesia pubescens]
MSLSMQSPPASFFSSSSLPKSRLRFANAPSSSSTLLFKYNRSFPVIRASSGSSSSLDNGLSTELDVVSTFSEIVPDSVIFDDFEKFPPTAATVSSSLLLGILSLPDTIFKHDVDMALADSSCSGLDNPERRLSYFVNKALVNVGGDLAKLVPGRVSTEVDARLAYDTHGIVRRVHDLLKLYNEIDVPPERLLFKIPSTWEGIEASRLLESEGIQTHLTFVYRTGHAIILVTLRLKLLFKEERILGWLWVEYIIAPLKVLQSLKESISAPDEKYSYVRRLSPQSAASYNFTAEELAKWDQLSLASAMGPASVELLAAGLDGYVNQAKRVEEFFDKIWPPPNV